MQVPIPSIWTSQREPVIWKQENSISATLQLPKKTVIVKADNKTVLIGDDLPEATVTYSGFVGGDTAEDALDTAAVAIIDPEANTDESGTFDIIFDTEAVLNDTIGANYMLVHEDGILTVKAELINYTIVATAGTNGSISPSGIVSVEEGTSKTFTFTPASGYVVDVVKVDGVVVTTNGKSYTFADVDSDHSISVTFKKSSGSVVPQTGDTASPLWAMLLLAGASSVLLIRKKSKD